MKRFPRRYNHFGRKRQISGIGRSSTHTLQSRIQFLRHTLREQDQELQYYQALVQAMNSATVDMLLVVDAQAVIRSANPAFKHMMHLDRLRPGLSCLQFVHEADRPLLQAALQRTLDREGVSGFIQVRLMTPSRQVLDAEIQITGLAAAAYGPLAQMLIRDVTEHNLLKQYLMISKRKLRNVRTSAILGLAKLAESRDEDTGLHLERIQEYAKLMAHELAKTRKYEHIITPEYIEDLGLSSVLHDIGKVGVPDAILFKPARLSREEYEQIKLHTLLGGSVLSELEELVEGQSFLSLGKEIALSHHERWDGQGYPQGLSGLEIPLAPRLVALADVYDALTSTRCYKVAYSHAQAVRIIINEQGSHFDPDVVKAFYAQEQSFNRLRRTLALS